MTHLVSLEHLATLAVIAVGIAGLTVAIRVLPDRRSLALGRMVAVALVANQAAWQVSLVATHAWIARQSLPLDLCDDACLVAAAALWTRNRALVEVTWFWALAGTLQALITPDTGAWHFPQFQYVQYYTGHALIVAAAIALVVGARLRPQRGAVGRAVAATLLATAIAAVADRLTGGDYMFLAAPPAGGSVLNLLGPWPIYLLPAAVLALGFFWLLDRPFAHPRRSFQQ